MLYWLASYPRSGNTFFRILLNSHLGLETYSVYNDPMFARIGASEAIGHTLLPTNLTQLPARPEPFFVKTHELPSGDLPAVYLVRDGRDCLVSYSKFIPSFNYRARWLSSIAKITGFPFHQVILRQLIVGDRSIRLLYGSSLYGGWNRHVQAWPARREGTTHILRYEDLCREPERRFAEVLDALGVVRPSSVGSAAPNFESLQSQWPNFFRKGKIGAWQEDFTPKLHDLFWKHHSEGMRLHGYTRD